MKLAEDLLELALTNDVELSHLEKSQYAVLLEMCDEEAQFDRMIGAHGHLGLRPCPVL